MMHLLRRALVAPTVAETQAAQRLSPRELVDRLVTPTVKPPEPPRFVGEWMNNPTAFFSLDIPPCTRAFADEMRRWWCGLMLAEGFSMRERLALFWHNHFPSDFSITKDGRFSYMQNQLLRRYALGNFKRLVREITVDKAMLWYLDGKLNKRDDQLNENYARELQELFTVGLYDNNGKPNYTQKDVREAARVLTGWGFYGDGITGDVQCTPWFGHDPGDKVVYGRTIAGREYGDAELDDLLDIIFDHEQTARYVIRKLYRFFVYTNAPLTPASHLDDAVEENIIAPLAQEFRASDWNVAVVLRRLLLSDHFYDPALIGAMIKSPVDLLVGTARALRVGGMPDDATLQYLHTGCETLGQTLLIPPGVQGWQFHHAWISSTTLPQRHALTDGLINGAPATYGRMPPGVLLAMPEMVTGTAKLNVMAFAQQFAEFNGDPELLVADIARHMMGYPASGRLAAELRDALLQGGPTYEWAGLEDAIKERRLGAMLRTLMRSANYQLM